MGLLSPSFLLGSVLLLYLLSFVLLAVIRIATGISIQRIGYFSLRRVAYTPSDGIRVEIRGLGLGLHRPTFAQPTWVSVKIEELKVTLDVQGLKGRSAAERKPTPSHQDPISGNKSARRKSSIKQQDTTVPRSRLWKRLTQIKEHLKSLHNNIHWLCLVDVVATDTTLVLVDIATFETGAINIAVDTRRQTVDRGRLFQHKKIPAGDQRPAEWILTVRGILFTPVGKEPLDIVDICSLNVHGLLYKEKAGLRDTSISLKLGRIHLPYDDITTCLDRIQRRRHQAGTSETNGRLGDQDATIVKDSVGELDQSGSREESIVQTFSDSKEFVSSILRGIQEIQMAISFVGLSKALPTLMGSEAGPPIYLNFVMNEFGIDLHRLDSKSPAHRMYFASKDVAHQALLAAISMAVSLDDGVGKPERITYVPMATATVKTTLPSKTVSFSEDKDVAERNANILYANLVVTSPSIDVDPNHMPLVLALVQWRQQLSPENSSHDSGHHQIVRRLLPKASIKFSVHEPVLRVALPIADGNSRENEDYDLLICSISSIFLDLESSHSSAGDFHYSLVSHLRVSSHQFYYQNSRKERHDLFVTDAIELKLSVDASPEVCVQITGNMQTFLVHMVRPEISAGVRQIMLHLRNRYKISSESGRDGAQANLLRALPSWLVYVQLQGSNFGLEVAGIDREVSGDTRGFALQLESWTAEYKGRKSVETERPTSRRRSASKSKRLDEPAIMVTPPQLGSPQLSPGSDGRRLAVHVKGFDGLIVEGLEVVEPEPFISIPRGEVAFSTSSDSRGRILHLSSHIKAVYVHCSLYRSYAIAIAFLVLRKAFVFDTATSDSSNPKHSENHPRPLSPAREMQVPELLSIDLKADLLQVKTTFPSQPHMMLQIYSLEAGRHRWAAPFIRSGLGRIYVQVSQMKSAWARVVSMKNMKLDLRESRKRRGHKIVEEHSLDIAADSTRIAVPHQVVPHTLFDNLVNAFKTTEYLYQKFLTNADQYILDKRPQSPKHVPRISLRSKILVVELEDGPFEWKLGSIYRAGLMEQKQRIARQEAFESKLSNIEKMHRRQRSSHLRTSSPQGNQRNRSGASRQGERVDLSLGGNTHTQDGRRPQAGEPNGHLRYDPEGQVGLSGSSVVSEKDARYRLQVYNAQSWKRRIDAVYRKQNLGMREMRNSFLGASYPPDSQDRSERILEMPERPGLLTAWINDFHLIIDKPSFPVHDYSSFIHRVGKGMPSDMEYTLLIPCSIQLSMGEARVTVRDYPLPLLHVPALRPGQSSKLPSWSVKTDFVIAEEFRGTASTKQVKVEVVPRSKFSDPESLSSFAVDLERTVSPVKTYSDIEILVNTSAPTSIMWGTSYQPAIQDSMMTIEGFTKPQVDPSDRIGFWDKIRLNFHSRINVLWAGDGDVHLRLKGSRDPYVVTGYGAGFVMCWRNNVRWEIHRNDDPKRFMSVTSGEYLLAIPDYSHEARSSKVSAVQDNESVSSLSSSRSGAMFKKVIMKLSGNVQWLAGLVLERDVEGGGRSFRFTPHYDVVLTTPERARALPGKVVALSLPVQANANVILVLRCFSWLSK